MTLAKVLAKELATPTGAILEWGVVHTLHTSPNSLDLYVNGSSSLTLTVRYLKSYTPTAGDVVVILRVGPDRIVLGLPG